MSIGRQWMRWLALLLAAGMVMQVPGLVGIGPSGARAARPGPTATPKPKGKATPTYTPSPTATPTATPTPSYTASLSPIDASCKATIVATWKNAPVQSVKAQLIDNNTQASVSERSTVSGTSGSQTFSVPLNSLLTGPVNSHAFHAVVDFVSSGNSLAQEIYTNSQNGPCYMGQVGL